MTGTRVIVPMKPLSESKSRLAGVLSPNRRALLSLGAFAHLLTTARSIVGVDEVVAIGGDRLVAAAAGSAGARWQPEPARGLNPVLHIAFEEAWAAGYTSCLYLPADLPLVTAADIESLIAAASARDGLALAPDRAGEGTNALLLPARLAFEPAFGLGSFERHQGASRALGLTPAVCRGAGLLLDVDTGDDLDFLLVSSPTWWQDAAALLRKLGLPEELLQPQLETSA